MTPQQLKDSILQLAIEGKLVPQIESEGNAEDLFKQIQKEKAELIKRGLIKREKPLDPIAEDEIPFDIPQSWKWVRTGEIGSWASGATPSRSNPSYYGGSIPWLKTGDLTDGYITDTSERITEKALAESSVRINPVGSILMAMYGATIGKLGILKIPATTNQACCACVVFNGVSGKYLFYYLMSMRKQYIGMAEGGAQPNISKEKIVSSLFPLPPLAEQKRIVAKIEELLPMVDKYGEAYNQLVELEKQFPTDLKKSVLQYAMKGKLVPQIDSEGNGEDLYKQIQKEKTELIKKGAIKKEKPLGPITDDEIPFDIPQSWKWVRLDEICTYIHRGKSPKYGKSDLPIIAQKCNQWDGLHLDRCLFADKDSISSYTEERFVKSGDIIINSTGGGTVGRTGFITESVLANGRYVCDSHITTVRCANQIHSRFYYYFLVSPIIQVGVEERCSGSTNQIELGTDTVKNYLVPLPPLAEQKRIVDKIEELFSIIDKKQA